jgi:hypothetical protein
MLQAKEHALTLLPSDVFSLGLTFESHQGIGSASKELRQISNLGLQFCCFCLKLISITLY